MSMLCKLLGHKWENHACTRKNCAAIQFETIFSDKEWATLKIILQFSQKYNDKEIPNFVTYLSARFSGSSFKQSGCLKEVWKNLLLAKENGWDTESGQIATALHAAAKELISKEGGGKYIVTGNIDFVPINELIIKTAKTLQASGDVKESEKKSFKQIASSVEASVFEKSNTADAIKTSGYEEEPVKQNTILEKITEANKGFFVLIDDVISKQGRGTYVKGIVKGEGINVGDAAYIVKTSGSVMETIITDIRDDVESPAGIRNSADIGDSVALLLRGIATFDVAKGDVLSATEKLPLKQKKASEQAMSRTEAEEQIVEIARRTVPPASELFYYFICSGNQSLIQAYHDLFKIGAPIYGGSAACYRADRSQLDARKADTTAVSLSFAGQKFMGSKAEEVATAADVLAMGGTGYMGVFISFVAVGSTGQGWVQEVYTGLLGQAAGQGIIPFYMYTTASKDAAQFLLDSFTLVSTS